MSKYRAGRINQEMKKEISDIIQNHVRDPRMNAMVSVTKVDVTKDLRYAKVYVSIFGNDDSKDETFDVLKHSAGFIRREIGQRIKLRYTPEIVFEIDNSIEEGMHIDELLQQIKETSHHDNK